MPSPTTTCPGRTVPRPSSGSKTDQGPSRSSASRNGRRGIASETLPAGVTGHLRNTAGADRYALLARWATDAAERRRAERRLEPERARFGRLTEHSTGRHRHGHRRRSGGALLRIRPGRDRPRTRSRGPVRRRFVHVRPFRGSPHRRRPAGGGGPEPGGAGRGRDPTAERRRGGRTVRAPIPTGQRVRTRIVPSLVTPTVMSRFTSRPVTASPAPSLTSFMSSGAVWFTFTPASSQAE